MHARFVLLINSAMSDHKLQISLAIFSKDKTRIFIISILKIDCDPFVENRFTKGFYILLVVFVLTYFAGLRNLHIP